MPAKTPSKKKIPPQLAAAFFCERTIEDKEDGVVSAIRIIDVMSFNLGPDAPPDFPSPQHPLPVQVAGLVSFRTGDFPGDHLLRLVLESPSGKLGDVSEKIVQFSTAANGGFNLRFNSVINVSRGGLFWLHVFLDGKRVTRMPLMIRIERSQPSSQEPKTTAP